MRTNYQIKADGKVYNRGTLAQILDSRDIPVGEPTAQYLPAAINPLKFLCNNLIVNNGFIVKIKQEAIQVDNNYLKLLSDLSYTVPPEKSVLICIELAPVLDEFVISSNNEEVTICDSVGDDTVMTVVADDHVQIAYSRDECNGQ